MQSAQDSTAQNARVYQLARRSYFSHRFDERENYKEQDSGISFVGKQKQEGVYAYETRVLKPGREWVQGGRKTTSAAAAPAPALASASGSAAAE